MDSILSIQDKLSQLRIEEQDLRHKKNALAKEIGKISGSLSTLEKQASSSSESVSQLKEERDRLVAQGSNLRDMVNSVSKNVQSLTLELYSLNHCFPNFPLDGVPIESPKLLKLVNSPVSGSELEAKNALLREYVSESNSMISDFIPESSYNKLEQREFLEHRELVAKHKLVDFHSASIASGPKFCYLLNEAALLEHALIRYTLDKLVPQGFTPVSTPDIIHTDILEGCGFQARGPHSQTYHISERFDEDMADSDELVESGNFSSLSASNGVDPSLEKPREQCLTGTAEMPLAALHYDSILQPADLPIRYAGVGHCFRAEAGSRGKQSGGLYRLHQFSKVELFSFTKPEESNAELDRLIDLQIDLYSSLGIHFRVADMPQSDLGAPAARKIDIEAWMPGRKEYGEISSTSSCTDYQARRMKIRYRNPDSSKKGYSNEFVHTLNGTGVAVPRMLIAIFETFQNGDGTKIQIPPVLQPYLNGTQEISRV